MRCSNNALITIHLIVNKITDYFGIISGWIMLFASGCICYEILSRALYAQATVWVYDITTYALIWFTFTVSGYVLKKKRHLCVDFIVVRCTPKVNNVIEIISTILIIILSGLIFYYSAHSTYEAFVSGELEPTIIRTPLYIIYLGMVVGVLVLLLQSILQLIDSILVWKTIETIDDSRLIIFRNAWLYVLICISLIAIGIFVLLKEYIAFGLLIIMLTMLMMGIPVFVSLGLVGISGLFMSFGIAGLPQIAQISYKAVESNVLLAVPLYVLAGQILQSGRIGPELFSFASVWIGHLRGGYAVATIVACAIFAAISGSSVATAAAIGMMAIPEMIKRGYKPSFAYGLVAVGGTLGILIPPSTPMILYSSMTEESTGALFMGGVFPGILLVIIYSIYAVIVSEKSNMQADTWNNRFAATKTAIWGLLAPLIVLVGIYTGAFTPTEAAAIAVIYALLVSIIRGTIRIKNLNEVLSEGSLSSGMIMMIIVGAILLGVQVTILQVPQKLIEYVQALQISRWTVFAILCVIYLILGMFLEVVSILLITAPIVYPLIKSMGFNGLWFGIVLVVLMEFAIITPPVGLNLFTIQGITKAPLAEIIRGVLPFIILMIIGLIAVILFPQLSLWLPGTMGLSSH